MKQTTGQILYRIRESGWRPGGSFCSFYLESNSFCLQVFAGTETRRLVIHIGAGVQFMSLAIEMDQVSTLRCLAHNKILPRPTLWMHLRIAEVLLKCRFPAQRRLPPLQRHSVRFDDNIQTLSGRRFLPSCIRFRYIRHNDMVSQSYRCLL